MKLDDPEGLARSSRLARELGFDGKSAIHPAQLPVIHEVFSPSTEEVAWAKEVLETLDVSVEDPRQGAENDLRRGAALLGGELVEAPHVLRARRILALAEQLGAIAPSEA